jgi:hypothetical protein
MGCDIVAKSSRICRLSVAAAVFVLGLCSVAALSANGPMDMEVQAALASLQTELDKVATRPEARISLRPEAIAAQRSVFLYVVSGETADPAVEAAYQVLAESIDRQSNPGVRDWPVAQAADAEPRTTQVLLRLLANSNNCEAVKQLRARVDQNGHFSRSTDMTFLLQALRTRPAQCNGDEAEALFRYLYGLDKLE